MLARRAHRHGTLSLSALGASGKAPCHTACGNDQRPLVVENAGRAAVQSSSPAGLKSKFGSSSNIVFQCSSLEGAAVQMRQRVQLGIGLEVFGTQMCNFLNYSDATSFGHAMNNFYFENSAALLALHVFAMWHYHVFLRDSLLARHVTGIAMPTARVESVSAGSDDSDVLHVVECVVQIKTGPWTRHIEITRPRSTSDATYEVDKIGSQVPLSKLFKMGLLHTDLVHGEVLDCDAFNQIVNGNFIVGREDIMTDVPSSRRSFLSEEKTIPLLAESGVSDGSDRSSSFMSNIENTDWFMSSLQFSGARALDYYGKAVLLMGLGTVVFWLPWR